MLPAQHGLLFSGLLFSLLFGTGTLLAQGSPSASPAGAGGATGASRQAGAEPAAGGALPLAPVTRAFLPETVDLSARFSPLPLAAARADGAPAAWAVTYLLRSYQTPEAGRASRDAETSAPDKTAPNAGPAEASAAEGGATEADAPDRGMRHCPSAPQHFRAAVAALETLTPPTRPVRQPADVFCPISDTGAGAGGAAGADAPTGPQPEPMIVGPSGPAPSRSTSSPSTSSRLGAGPTRGLVRASQPETAREAGFTPDSLERLRRLLAQSHPVLLSLRSADSALPGASPPDPAEARGEEIALALGYDDRRQALHLLSFRAADIGRNRLYWLPYAQVLQNGRDTVAYGGRAPMADAPTGEAASGNLPAGYVSSGAPSAGLPLSSPPGESSPVPAAAVPPGPSPALGIVGDAAPAGPSCASLKVEAGALTGFVATSEELARVRGEAAARGLRDAVSLRPWPICEALLTLREMQGRPEAPAVALVGGDRPLRVGETFAVAVAPPRRPSYLYVIYLEDDGSVVNLAPRRGVLRRQTPANAPPLLFGDGKQGRPTFRVTPLRAGDVDGRPRTAAERGHEAVIVIAATAPIAELEAAEAEGSPFYRAAPLRQDPQAVYPDRLFLSMLRGITQRRVADDAAPREVSAAILPLQIEE